jgi:hypothetical protein
VSLNRFATKVDATQKEVVRGLRAVRVKVFIIKKPCDLLLWFWCNRHRDFCWQTLEVKTPQGKKDPKASVRADQTKQTQFLLETHTPIATSFEDAWRQLNQRHNLGALKL